MLTVVCSGGTVTSAAQQIDVNVRAIQRFASDNPDFGAQLERAKALALTQDQDAIEQLLASVAVDPPQPGIELDPVRIVPPDAPEREPAVVFDAEVVDEQAELDQAASDGSVDPDRIVPGLPALNERNYLAFLWRTMHNPTAHPGIVACCIRALKDHVLQTRNHRRLRELDENQQRRRAQQREKGLTRETISEVQRRVIGPKPQRGRAA